MKWLKRITGIQELINDQKITNDLLNVLIMLEREKAKEPPKPKVPRYKGDGL